MAKPTCEDCGKQLHKYGARWCKPHGYTHRRRPTGMKYVLHKVNPTSFKKGHTPWQKGTTGLVTAWNKGIKGSVKPNSGSFRTGDNRGEKAYQWKGDNVGYVALHRWVSNRLGKPNKCEHCGTTTAKKFEWANKSREYRRDLTDWLRLCTRCHNAYDEGTWGAVRRRFK